MTDDLFNALKDICTPLKIDPNRVYAVEEVFAMAGFGKPKVENGTLVYDLCDEEQRRATAGA